MGTCVIEGPEGFELDLLPDIVGIGGMVGAGDDASEDEGGEGYGQ